MNWKLTPLCFFALAAYGQDPDPATLARQADELRELVRRAPRRDLTKTELKIQAGVELGYPSSVAMGREGIIYVLHRGEKSDPVLAVDTSGRILRSWGKGLYQIPHSIRVDPQGNVWTVDAASSRVMKFDTRGHKLMEISVGGQPV